MAPPTGAVAGAAAIVLEHPNPALSLRLYRAADGVDVLAQLRE
jgi:hypothetical protein